MDIIVKGRGQGKTEDLITKASAGWLHIVCINREETLRIQNRARERNLEIPFPLTFGELINGAFHAGGCRGFLIDNADILLQSLCKRVPIDSVTMTIEGEPE